MGAARKHDAATKPNEDEGNGVENPPIPRVDDSPAFPRARDF
jgi:hypothetical protein